MVQLRVKTEVQDDFVQRSPLQLPQPAPGNGKTSLFPSYTVGAAGLGGEEFLNIFYDTTFAGSTDIVNLFRETREEPWRVESTLFSLAAPAGAVGCTTLKSLKDLTTGNLHLAYGARNTDQTYHLWYLEPNTRYKAWASTTVPTATGDSLSRALDIFYDKSGNVNICCHVENLSSDTGKGYKWIPSQGGSLVPVPELDPFPVVADIAHGAYQDIAVNPSGAAQEGYYVSSGSLINGIVNSEIYRSTVPAQPLVNATLSGPFLSTQTVYLKDPNSAPLLFAIQSSPPQVYFITNSHYSNNNTDMNVVPIFTDVPLGRKPVSIRAVVSEGPGIDDSGAPLAVQPMRIDVLVLFQRLDFSYELWHSVSLNDGVEEVSDGIYNVAAGNWTTSALITSDILSPLEFSFQWSDNPFSFTVIDGAPTAVVIDSNRTFQIFTREAELGLWSISSVLSATLAPQITTSNIYFVEVTTLMPDGTVMPNLACQLGSHSLMAIEVNGINRVLDKYRTLQLSFPSSGMLRIKIRNNGELIPPTFWIWAEGMDASAKVDIQAGPNGVHEKLKNVGTAGHDGLGDITLEDGSHLVPPGQPQGSLDAATQALHAVSDVITGDVAPDPDEQQYIYKSTSANVARGRSTKPTHLPLGLIQRKKPIGFIINFSGGKVTFNHFSAAQIANPHTEFDGLEGIGDSIETLWGDFKRNVLNKIYEVASIVVKTLEQGAQVAITFVVDGVTKVYNGIVKLAAQAADLALFVFNAIKTGIEKVIEWLKFWFDWDDIKATARHFQSDLVQTGPVLSQFVDIIMSKGTDAVFQYARNNIDGACDKIITALSGKTVGSFDGGITLKDATALTNFHKPRTHGSNLDFGSAQDLIDGLSSSASYLVDKFIDAIGLGSNNTLASDQGLQKFYDSLNNMFGQIVGEQARADFQQAMSALQIFFSRFFSRSIFESSTVGALINAFRGLMKLSLDLLQAVLHELMILFKEVAQLAAGIFTADFSVPGLRELYQFIMGSDECTVGGVLSLVIAVPVTLIYKAVTNEAPYPSTKSSVTKSVITSDLDKLHIILGSLGLVRTIVGGIDDFIQSRRVASTAPAALAPSAIQMVLVAPAVINQARASTSSLIDLLSHKHLATDPNQDLLDTAALVFTACHVGFGLTRWVIDKVGAKLKKNVTVDVKDLAGGLDLFTSIGGLTIEMVALAYSAPNSEKTTTLGVGIVFSCSQGIASSVARQVTDPKTKLGFTVAGFAFGIISGSCSIAGGLKPDPSTKTSSNSLSKPASLTE